MPRNNWDNWNCEWIRSYLELQTHCNSRSWPALLLCRSNPTSAVYLYKIDAPRATGTTKNELQRFKSLCENSCISQVAIVYTHWTFESGQADLQNKRFQAKDQPWEFFIGENAIVEQLRPKSSDSPFERNPIDDKDARKILLDVIDKHPSTREPEKTLDARQQLEEIKQEIRHLKLIKAKRSGNLFKIMYYSLWFSDVHAKFYHCVIVIKLLA